MFCKKLFWIIFGILIWWSTILLPSINSCRIFFYFFFYNFRCFSNKWWINISWLCQWHDTLTIKKTKIVCVILSMNVWVTLKDLSGKKNFTKLRSYGRFFWMRLARLISTKWIAIVLLLNKSKTFIPKSFVRV